MSVTIYADVGCPFAHRVTSFLTHLGVPFDVELCPIGGPQPPRALEFGLGIPLYVDSSLGLTESRVILEHIAERYEYEHARPADAGERVRQRHAMALVDTVVAPRIFTKRGPALERVERAAQIFEAAIEDLSQPGLFTFQMAPFWYFLKVARPRSPVISVMSSHRVLARWLDDAVQIPAVAQAATPPPVLLAEIARFRRDRKNELRDARVV